MRGSPGLTLAHSGVLNYERYAPLLYGAPVPLPSSTPTLTPSASPTPTSCQNIVLDYVPPYGSSEDLRGHVTCVAYGAYRVAVYIYVSGWWTKPSFASPLTAILSDGSWATDITTGESDPLATQIAAFLIPNSYTPPALAGSAALPPELYALSVAHVSATRSSTRSITFSGQQWQVKSARTPAGPGPNYFSDDPQDVWVDEKGCLHLNIVKRAGKWFSTEVISTDRLQYGSYTFTLGSRVDQLDPNVVLGLFSWDGEAPQYNYREIDIEFSRWGEAAAAYNAQYVIQPWQTGGNRHRFDLNLGTDDSVHRFVWRAGSVQFDSWDGNGSALQSWTYARPVFIPPAGAGNARINLWLLNGWAPENGQNVEIVIKAFQLTPAGS